MEELVQDLASALEESELKNEIDSESSRHGELRVRRLRKRRPTADSTPGLPMLMKATDSCGSDIGSNLREAFRSHYIGSGSETEDAFAFPTTRKHRRKKIKRMETDAFHVKHNHLKRKESKTKMDCSTTVVSSSNNKDEEKELNKTKQRDDESSISDSDNSVSNEEYDAQDGDDEMTDFYTEPGGGAVCGIPNIIPWWDEESRDLQLQNIINNALPHMSTSAKRGFHARVNRLPGMAARSIRKGRRKMKFKKLNERHYCGNDSSSKERRYSKRRKEETFLEELVSKGALPIPDTNQGHRMLLQMGWAPGQGLGLNNQGISTPVTAERRRKRSGLGS